MISYEDLPEDLKVMYTKEQCEQLIVIAEKMYLWALDFMESLRKIVQAMQPTLEKLAETGEKIKKLFNEHEVKEPLPKLNHKYLHYKPKVKQKMIYKKTIYYHIRNSC